MNQDKSTDDFLSAISRIEVSGKNSQDDIKKLYLHSARQEIAIEALNGKVDDVKQHLSEHDKRFDKIEDTLSIIASRLSK